MIRLPRLLECDDGRGRLSYPILSPQSKTLHASSAQYIRLAASRVTITAKRKWRRLDESETFNPFPHTWAEVVMYVGNLFLFLQICESECLLGGDVCGCCVWVALVVVVVVCLE